jgi:hypothetical protein
MSAIAAPRSGNPRPVSYMNAWWAVVQSLLVGVIILILGGVVLMLVGLVAGLPLGVPGSSWTPLASLSDLVGGRSIRACCGFGWWIYWHC